MTQATVFASSESWLGCARESVRGVAEVAPTFWIPTSEPKLSPLITEQPDSGVRGQMNAQYGQMPTVRHDEHTFKFLAHVDVLPAVMRSVLGSADTVTGTGPYTHVLSLLNTPAPAQPPSYTWFDWDGFRLRVLKGGQTDTVIIRFLSTDWVRLEVKVLAYPFTVAGSVPPASISDITPAPTWDCVQTFNSNVLTNVQEGSIEFHRDVVSIHTLNPGSNAPYSLFAGPLRMKGQMKFLNADDSELNVYLNNTLAPLNLSFSALTPSNYGFSLDFAAVKASLGAQERGSDDLITAMVDLVPLPNSTDATAGGLSPVKGTFLNAQSGAY